MGRHAQAHTVEAGASEVGDGAGGRHRHHQREGAGPEGLGKTPGRLVEDALDPGGLEAVQVGDQRVEARALLGGVNAGDGLRIRGIGPEAVDGLRREGHEAAVAQDLRHAGKTGIIGRQTLRLAH
jgi:hypothetical protein